MTTLYKYTARSANFRRHFEAYSDDGYVKTIHARNRPVRQYSNVIPFGMSLEELREELRRTARKRILDCDLPGYTPSKDGLTARVKVRVIKHKGLFVEITIDRADIERTHEWTLAARKLGNHFDISIPKGRTSYLLGRLLLNVTDPDLVVAHKNRNPLDFRRSNLKTVKSGTFKPNWNSSSRANCKRTAQSQSYAPYGPDWPPMRGAAIERSSGVCERCHKNDAVHVHHKLPVRFFAIPNDANFLENLEAVCRGCHRKEHRDIAKNLPLLNEMLRSWRLKELKTEKTPRS